MRKVFLDELPHKQYGNKSAIDWNNSIGYTVNFVYDDIKGNFEIINYNSKNQKLAIKYMNYTYEIVSQSVLDGRLGIAIGVKSNSFKYNVGDIIETNTGKIQIIKHIHIHNKHDSNRRGYEYQCLIDNYIGKIIEKDLLNGTGCPVCSNRKVFKGVNDMWTTNPELAKLLANPDDGYKYTQSSHHHLDWKCPDCGNIIKNREIKSINNRGLCCPKCSDGISYPEKFMYNLLQQLNVNFVYQLSHITFDWCKGHNYDVKYDFYIPSINCIIETHGLQHYDNNNGCWDNTTEQQQENDKFKKQLAIENNIKNYIVIDCRYSNIEWIKNSILNSKLLELFDLSNVNWTEINKQSYKSIIKEVCDMWKIGVKNTNILHHKFKLNICCIREYLHRGEKLGWCDYNPKHSETYIIKHQYINKNKKER